MSEMNRVDPRVIEKSEEFGNASLITENTPQVSEAKKTPPLNRRSFLGLLALGALGLSLGDKKAEAKICDDAKLTYKKEWAKESAYLFGNNEALLRAEIKRVAFDEQTADILYDVCTNFDRKAQHMDGIPLYDSSAKRRTATMLLFNANSGSIRIRPVERPFVDIVKDNNGLENKAVRWGVFQTHGRKRLEIAYWTFSKETTQGMFAQIQGGKDILAQAIDQHLLPYGVSGIFPRGRNLPTYEEYLALRPGRFFEELATSAQNNYLATVSQQKSAMEEGNVPFSLARQREVPVQRNTGTLKTIE